MKNDVARVLGWPHMAVSKGATWRKLVPTWCVSREY